MSTFIKDLEVVEYKGIDYLKLDNLAFVNVLVGDNGCGKTSILEKLSESNHKAVIYDYPQMYLKTAYTYTRPLVEIVGQDDDLIDFCKNLEPLIIDVITGYNIESNKVEMWFGTSDKDKRVEISQKGSGFIKLVGLYMALKCSGATSIYIDELENGLHFSLYKELWKLILDTAFEQHTQIFITTHSYEMLEVLNNTYQEWLDGEVLYTDDVLAVYGVEKRDNQHMVKRFTPKSLDVLLRYNFEVRSLGDFEDRQEN